MKIFYSWSGDYSKEIAKVFKNWLPNVIQKVIVYFSDEDIEKGKRWETEISRELSESHMGILFLTKENINSTWLHFEAGSLAKNIDKACIYTLLFDLEYSDIKPPLTMFQATKFNKTDIKKFLYSVNNQLNEDKLPESNLETILDTWWPKLETDVNKIDKSKFSISPVHAKRNDSEVLDEILNLVRELTYKNEMIRYLPTQLDNIFLDLIDTFINSFNNYGHLKDDKDNLTVIILKDVLFLAEKYNVSKDVYIKLRKSIGSLLDLLDYGPISITRKMFKDINSINKQSRIDSPKNESNDKLL